MTAVMLLVCLLSIGQNHVTNDELSKVVSSVTQIEQNNPEVHQYRLIAPLAILAKKQRDAEYYKKSNTYDDKEWAELKEQMKKNRKKISYDIYVSKTLDTIYLDVPLRCNNSRLSDL